MDTVSIRYIVNDVDAAIEFYRDALGFTVDMHPAPGFAGPWEQAKQSAYHDLAEEDAGRATPKRFFQRFFGGGNTTTVESVKALPTTSEQKPENASAS